MRGLGITASLSNERDQTGGWHEGEFGRVCAQRARTWTCNVANSRTPSRDAVDARSELCVRVCVC
jgi:hypothetical protein